jgi:hypothetical protein
MMNDESLSTIRRDLATLPPERELELSLLWNLCILRLLLSPSKGAQRIEGCRGSITGVWLLSHHRLLTPAEPEVKLKGRVNLPPRGEL